MHESVFRSPDSNRWYCTGTEQTFRTRQEARAYLRAERLAGRLPGRVRKPQIALEAQTGPSEGGT